MRMDLNADLGEGMGDDEALLDIVTYRMSGHSPSDASSYRSKEEMELWEAADCVRTFGEYLISNGALTEACLLYTSPSPRD